MKLKSLTLSFLVGLVASSAIAEDRYLVRVPANVNLAAPEASAPEEATSIALRSSTLPAGTVGVPYGETQTGFDLSTLLDVTPSSYSLNDISWSVVSGALPAGLEIQADGKLAGTPTVKNEAGASFEVQASYKGEDGRQVYSIIVLPSSAPSSCLALLQTNPNIVSGWYDLSVGGEVASYYCDMTSDGGGWTRIVRQTELEPVANWNGGINGASYALETSKIPEHTQIAFGRDESATYIGFVDGYYSTGDISKVRLVSPKTGQGFYLHRSSTSYHADHDPRLWSPVGIGDASGTWAGTLTFIGDFGATGSGAYGWSYSSQNETAAYRGFRMGGARTIGADTYAWTVWVR